jgi:hypothetical protein
MDHVAIPRPRGETQAQDAADPSQEIGDNLQAAGSGDTQAVVVGAVAAAVVDGTEAAEVHSAWLACDAAAVAEVEAGLGTAGTPAAGTAPDTLRVVEHEVVEHEGIQQLAARMNVGDAGERALRDVASHIAGNRVVVGIALEASEKENTAEVGAEFAEGQHVVEAAAGRS